MNTGLTDRWSNIPIVSTLAVSGTNLYAGTDLGVFLSTNNGTNWIAMSNGLMSNPVVALTGSGTNLFAGTLNGGVFLSTNNGTSWTPINTGLAKTVIYILTVSGTNLFAGTEIGVWKRPLSEITSVEKLSTDLPTNFRLGQNYPNPFNPSTTISFIIPSKSYVLLKIYDLLGREIAIITSEELSAGTYTRQWNASNMPSGFYFYRLQAGSFTEIKKLVLLK